MLAPICSLPEQQEIVRLLDGQFEVIEQNEREIGAALTHARLSELTGLHPSDVTKSLRSLVSKGFLVSEGSGRGTVYRFKGTPKITSEDVFSDPGSPNSEPSSPNLVSSSPNFPEERPGKDPEESERDAHGRLISSHFSMPFVDGLDHLAPTFREHLEQLADSPRSSRKIDREQMIETLLRLCDGHCIRLDSLACLVDRKPATLQGQYLTQLCRDQKLRMAFPDKPNDPRQAYTRA